MVEEKDGELLFRIYVQPKASKNQVVGRHSDPSKGDALKVKITAPPVDGAANAMCVKFFAKLLRVPKSSIAIVSGQTSRHKRVAVAFENGGTEKEKMEKIKKLLENCT